MPFPAHFLPQQTERLTLRHFTEADLDRFLAYRHDPVVARFQSWSMLSEREAIAFIHEMSTAQSEFQENGFKLRSPFNHPIS
jgi:RimJ/RimL family protein N-acetyltransferase